MFSQKTLGCHWYHTAPELGESYESHGKLNLQTPHVEARFFYIKKKSICEPFKLILIISGELELCCKDVMIKGRQAQLAFI